MKISREINRSQKNDSHITGVIILHCICESVEHDSHVLYVLQTEKTSAVVCETISVSIQVLQQRGSHKQLNYEGLPQVLPEKPRSSSMLFCLININANKHVLMHSYL